MPSRRCKTCGKKAKVVWFNGFCSSKCKRSVKSPASRRKSTELAPAPPPPPLPPMRMPSRRPSRLAIPKKMFPDEPDWESMQARLVEHQSHEKPNYRLTDVRDNVTEVWQGRTKCLTFVDGREGHPIDKSNYHRQGPDAEVAMQLAIRATRGARAILKEGVFNNQMPGGKDEKDEQDFYVTKVSPNWWMQIADALDRTVHSKDNFAKQMATKAAVPYVLGGGVCAHVAHLVCGILTTIAPPETQISLVWHPVDHQFCAVSHGKSDWFVVDPWTGYSFVCPWEYCCFERNPDPKDHGGNSMKVWEVYVHRGVEFFYGIPINYQKLKGALQRQQTVLGKIGPPQQRWLQNHNLIDPKLGKEKSVALVGGPHDWGDKMRLE